MYIKDLYIIGSQILMRIQGLRKGKSKKKLRLLISSSEIDNLEKDRLLYLTNYGDKYNDFIIEYLNCNLKCVKEAKRNTDESSPLVICVVKDDLLRIKLFINYYRNLGITHFVFLDDNSSDGTREFLLANDDITLYTANTSYTTIRRQVWINKLISIHGFNKWYLIVDSDELFDYKSRNKKTISEFIEHLKSNGQDRVKAILLDMFSPQGLFSNDIKNYADIISKCNLFYPHYSYKLCHYDMRIQGGARAAMFSQLGLQMKEAPYVSKYPLIFVKKDDILINSHCYLPANRNKPDYPETVLRHYKFLPGDKDKIKSRIDKGNFTNGSGEYKVYLQLDGDKAKYENVIHEMKKYVDFDSTSIIEIMKKSFR